MRILIILLAILVVFGGGRFGAHAEWIACNPAPENSDQDPENDVVSVVIMQDSAEIIRPYELNPSETAVLLIDTTVIAAATFSFRFENVQGRRSDPVIFELKQKPAGCLGLRVLH